MQSQATNCNASFNGQSHRIDKRRNGMLEQGFDYLSQLEPIAEIDGFSNVVAIFVYADKSHVPSYLLKGGNTYRIISDHLGSVRLVIDVASGVVTQVLDYDEYGNVTKDTSPGFQPFGFAGGIYDRDLDFVRFGSRDYDPIAGRWTTKDPALFGGRELNLYAYVGNAPAWRTDRTGQLIDTADMIGYLWGLLGVAAGGDLPNIRIDDRAGMYVVAEFPNHPGQNYFNYSTTFGDVICYAGRPTESSISHELAHARQYDNLGDAYLPAHIASQLGSHLLSGSYSDGNVLEIGPYSNPPTAWPWGD